jgi:hypothetical protein
MKSKRIVVALCCVLLTGIATAQTSTQGSTQSPPRVILGDGETGYLPVFSSPSAIGDSNIFQSTTGYIGIGTTDPIAAMHVFSNNPVGPPGYGPITMWVESSVDNAQGAIYAVASSPAGGIAVNGESYFGTGTGVIGQGNGSGVTGATSNPTDFATGVRGVAAASVGPGVGVFGENFSADGFAGLFINRAAGNIIEGRVNVQDLTVFRVDGNGRVFADGGFQAHGADFAESMAVTGDRNSYGAGDLLVIDPSAKRQLGLGQQPYSTAVAGIYSTKPGLLGSTHMLDEAAGKEEIPLAVVGIVPCKVTAENGPIQAGDLLVASRTPGRAMKGTDRSKMLGAVVGKALEPMPSGEGVIQVLVTLQ